MVETKVGISTIMCVAKSFLFIEISISRATFSLSSIFLSTIRKILENERLLTREIS
jgi:hypothetical protein